MLGWVTRLHTTVERQKTHYLDMRKPLLWCSAACFLLMQTSIDQLLVLIGFLKSRIELCALVSLASSNFILSVARFPELRDALEKLQLNDAALKVQYMTNML